MKVPYSWLAEWVKVPWPAPELGSRLTMAGIELEARGSAAPPFSGVVVAQIVSAEPHPQADKLQVCRVSTGSGETLQIVCGASNARAGLKSALALVGAKLPGDLTIKAAKLRGVESQGMLASAKELGLAEGSAGILELPPDAPLGRPLREYLALDEPVLDLNITPNRGDAMSVIGIAREVAALAGTKVPGPPIGSARAGHADRLSVQLEAPAACPRFAGCILRGVNNRAETPLWMRERLRRSGEPVTLLDGKAISAQADVLLITDHEGAVGLAGIMGGLRTAVSAETTDVFLESAYFSPDAVLGRARRLGLQTDASRRFERGCAPTQQRRAIERAIALLTPMAGGSAGPVEVTQSAAPLPQRAAVPLRAKQLTRLLGVELPAARVEATLAGLQMQVTRNASGWQVTPAAHRFDIGIEADLIEEVARVVGFEAIPETDALGPQRFRSLPEQHPPEPAVLAVLAARGYQEAITLAF